MPDEAPALLQARIELLTKFKATLADWFTQSSELEEENLLHGLERGSRSSPEMAEARTFINRNLVAARQAVQQAGVHCMVTGNFVGAIQSVDPFINVFGEMAGQSLVPDLLDMLDRAIGVYEHMNAGTGLVRVVSSGPFDVETAIERALRLAFKNGPPANEKEVQDQVEVILSSLGVEFTREQETAPVGPRAFKPDFALTPMDLALEVKFTNDKHSASKAQEEISADISAFKTKWSRLLVVVYDLGAIDDPQRMRNDNMKHFGVSVLIVKCGFRANVSTKPGQRQLPWQRTPRWLARACQLVRGRRLRPLDVALRLPKRDGSPSSAPPPSP